MEKPNVNDCEYIAVPSTWITKYHYKNQEELNECYNKFMTEGGNCVGESFRLFLKLRNVNAVRCRGNINNLKILKLQIIMKNTIIFIIGLKQTVRYLIKIILEL